MSRNIIFVVYACIDWTVWRIWRVSSIKELMCHWEEGNDIINILSPKIAAL
jgi:hypothetical protein